MIIDFSSIPEITQSCPHGGAGQMTSKMFSASGAIVTPCRIHPGGSIGTHRHENGADISYVLYGTGIAVCDGQEEHLTTDMCHICPEGSEHSIRNTGHTDLVLLSVIAPG